MNDLSYGIEIWAQVSFVLSQSTCSTDRQTDRRTDGQKCLSNTVCCITCSRTVKNWFWKFIVSF